MSLTATMAIVVVKGYILVVGAGIALIAYRAHKETNEDSLRALSVGFGVVTLGALLAGVLHKLFGLSLTNGVLLNSVLTAIGFSIIIYSLYLER